MKILTTIKLLSKLFTKKIEIPLQKISFSLDEITAILQIFLTEETAIAIIKQIKKEAVKEYINKMNEIKKKKQEEEQKLLDEYLEKSGKREVNENYEIRDPGKPVYLLSYKDYQKNNA